MDHHQAPEETVVNTRTMSDNEDYTFTSRPFNEHWRGYRDASGNVYEEHQFRDRSIPEPNYPLSQKIEGEIGEPVEHKIVVTPVDIWQDAAAFHSEVKTKLIIIPKDALTKYIPALIHIPTKPGYVFVASGSSFNGRCPRCDQQMGRGGDDNSGWTTHYACQCGAVLDLHHADMGGFDQWEFFEPV